MSRIGNKPITIPEKVEVLIKDMTISVKGPKGELATTIIDERIIFEINEGILTFSRTSEDKVVKSLHGLYRSLVANNIEGVLEGYSKTLTLVGVGHRVSMKGNDLEILCGFSHPVLFKKVENIKYEVPDQNTIIVSGIDKALVGEVSANIRAIKPPEPYKGKGIRYKDEYVRRKAGKAAVTAGA
ncbi:MAG: 50S ribosomal protein L6 [Actinobacteria bacterium]|jgi:large subunit ribosomal protein L6|nr:50S ribosomal protein L6 [Actinomycetota bacterium]MBT5655722.1 50S ribosomal protein L6 [Actinomycetota bacterium]MBT7014562.1 50S ribosomal protein L6 [Actinomycetota bacterium]MDA9607573.1 50S ribosomal protein L6 [Candidatus Actinomarina sp.]MDA9688051.1 50S ribosomal protein L6 [Candidatus Actinomarina sp.]